MKVRKRDLSFVGATRMWKWCNNYVINSFCGQWNGAEKAKTKRRLIDGAGSIFNFPFIREAAVFIFLALMDVKILHRISHWPEGGLAKRVRSVEWLQNEWRRHRWSREIRRTIDEVEGVKMIFISLYMRDLPHTRWRVTPQPWLLLQLSPHLYDNR